MVRPIESDENRCFCTIQLIILIIEKFVVPYCHIIGLDGDGGGGGGGGASWF